MTLYKAITLHFSWKLYVLKQDPTDMFLGGPRHIGRHFYLKSKKLNNFPSIRLLATRVQHKNKSMTYFWAEVHCVWISMIFYLTSPNFLGIWSCSHT